jgi:serine/threonine protein kinase/tetratricopeptide (TPR) repeat protein
MDFLFQIFFNPVFYWSALALALLVGYQKLALRFKFNVPGMPSGDEILGKLLGPGFAKAKLKRAVDKLKKDGNYLEAGRRLEDEGDANGAVEAYTEGQQFTAAAALLEKMGKAERAGELFLQGGDYKKAAQVFSQAGKHARAAQLFQEKGNNLEAARLYGLGNQWDKAAALYMKGGFAMRAAEAFEKCNDFVKAAEAYEKHFMENVSYQSSYSTSAGSPEQKAALLAGRLYEKAGDLKRALEIYQRGSYFKQAAEACLKAGDPHKAAELYMRAEDPGAAADAYEKAGDPVEAANLRGEVAFKAGRAAEAAAFFQQGRDYLRAAELFESAGMLAQAAGAYEAGDSFAAAGGVYMRAGIKDKAAAAYERGGDLETAAKLYEEAGHTAKAIELFDRAGHTFKSGEAAAKSGDYARAIALLQRVPPGDENHATAAELLAEAFIATGRPHLALERVKKAIDGQPASAANLNLYYWMAAAQDAGGKSDEALSIYKKIQAEDVDFRDVDQRVKRLQSAAPPVPPGAKIGKYILGQRIGQGAMGEVYKAHDPALKRDVAIKMIAATVAPDSDLKVRFEREAQSAGRMNHPNVVTVYEFGQEKDRIYLAMELLEGADLRGMINRHGLPSLGEKLAVMEQICEGLAYAHAHDVVHRDLKPGNIYVLPNGQAKLLDFGLARLGNSAEFTQSGVILGTPNYMSPEQVRGERVDARSDIFSLGAVFYELLSNRKAFDADSMQGVLYHVLNDEPESVRHWVPDLPEALIRVVERSLAKEPERRFQNATEMRDALRQARAAIPPDLLSTPRGAAAVPPAPRPAAPAPPPVLSSMPTVAPASPTLVEASMPAPPVLSVPTPPPAVPATPAPAGKGARFVPQAEIGKGPKGTLFRGGDSGGGQPVALRFLEPSVLAVDGAMTMLATDLKAAAAVVHPNLVKLVGFVEIGGKRCVVTELVPGKNFAEPLAAGKRAPFGHVLTLARTLAEALQAIHARNLVHGGIQPANLMAAGAVVKLNDFGLGRVFQNVTHARQYWPADGAFDPATDLYAAAATVYHLLTGVNPRTQATVVPPSSLTPGVPAAFDAVLVRALDPRRPARFPTAADLLAAINQAAKQV